MRKIVFTFIIAFGVCAFAQKRDHGTKFIGVLDASEAQSAKPFRVYAGSPTAGDCDAAGEVGSVALDSTATANPQYNCLETSSGVYGWVRQTSGGGAGFLFNCVSPTTAAANATNYCIGATLNSNEGRAAFQIPRNCTLGALRVRTSSSTGAALNLAGGTLTVTVRNGASDSALTCTVADGTSSCSDLAHTEAATAGVFTSLKLVGTGYGSAPYVQASFECQ